MSLRSLFAQNLRQLSATKKSHAHVARALDINRQQFNNYITGKNLPNETVVAKICKYFKVTEAYMFQTDSERIHHRLSSTISKRESRVLNGFLDYQLAKKKKPFFNGLYNVYFVNVDGDMSILCSLLAVRNDSGICTFRRITRLKRINDNNKTKVSGIHYGIASISQGRLFMLAVDRFDNYSVTLLTGIPILSTKVLYGGIATISTGIDIRQVPFVIGAAQSDEGVRQALKHAILYPSNSPLLDESVRQYLKYSVSLYNAAQASASAEAAK
jgi:transcriptional regulator with XRE-family HTH domain